MLASVTLCLSHRLAAAPSLVRTEATQPIGVVSIAVSMQPNFAPLSTTTPSPLRFGIRMRGCVVACTIDSVIGGADKI